jgi:4-hydroxy-tetrahydrodipicolinate synthase
MFTGLSAFPLTPLDEDGIDDGAFARLVARLAEAGVDSIAPLGSTGSYAYLSGKERGRVARLAVEAAGGVPVMVGIGALRTRDVLAHAHDAQKAGAAAVLLAPVSYQRLTDDEVLGLYTDVSAQLSVPLCVYDNPTTTRFEFSDALHAEIAKLPNVGAIKLPGDGAPERIARLRPLVPEGVALGVSGDWFAAPALQAGADVWFSVIGGLFPVPALAIARGDAQVADELEPLWDLFRRYGGVRVMATAAALRGFAGAPGLPRPLLPAPAAEVAPVLDALGL